VPQLSRHCEEQHSTRGRARLLWEMLAGALRKEGFQSKAVHEALDLCLSCKACKTECPVAVDMTATNPSTGATLQAPPAPAAPLHLRLCDLLAAWVDYSRLTNAVLTGASPAAHQAHCGWRKNASFRALLGKVTRRQDWRATKPPTCLAH